MPNAPPRKKSSTIVDLGDWPAEDWDAVIVSSTITTSSSSSSSTTNTTPINNSTPLNNSTPSSTQSDSISIRHLNAYPDIYTKRSYIIQHSTALQHSLELERAETERQLHRCHQALRKLHPKPLDMEKDILERQVERDKFEEQIPNLKKRLREIEEDEVLIQKTKDELTSAVGWLDEYYVEWTLMPGLVGDLMQLGYLG